MLGKQIACHDDELPLDKRDVWVIKQLFLV
jgi:hypothetical protein